MILDLAVGETDSSGLIGVDEGKTTPTEVDRTAENDVAGEGNAKPAIAQGLRLGKMDVVEAGHRGRTQQLGSDGRTVEGRGRDVCGGRKEWLCKQKNEGKNTGEKQKHCENDVFAPSFHSDVPMRLTTQAQRPEPQATVRCSAWLGMAGRVSARETKRKGFSALSRACIRALVPLKPPSVELGKSEPIPLHGRAQATVNRERRVRSGMVDACASEQSCE